MSQPIGCMLPFPSFKERGVDVYKRQRRHKINRLKVLLQGIQILLRCLLLYQLPLLPVQAFLRTA